MSWLDVTKSHILLKMQEISNDSSDSPKVKNVTGQRVDDDDGKILSLITGGLIGTTARTMNTGLAISSYAACRAGRNELGPHARKPP